MFKVFSSKAQKTRMFTPFPGFREFSAIICLNKHSALFPLSSLAWDSYNGYFVSLDGDSGRGELAVCACAWPGEAYVHHLWGNAGWWLWGWACRMLGFAWANWGDPQVKCPTMFMGRLFGGVCEELIETTALKFLIWVAGIPPCLFTAPSCP